MPKSYDAIIIGTGQAGPYVAQRLTGAGMKVAIIERKLFGGTCVNSGCTPTKAMVASAYAAHMIRRAADFGVVHNGPVSIDMKVVQSRKDAISAQSRTAVESWLRGMANCTVYQGHGRFESAREVSVGAERLAADRIFINVGGRASVPQMPGIEEVPYLTNSSILDLDFLPHHLIIVGGGYIGLEFAQMYRRFGSEVTMIQRAPHLAKHEDEDVSFAWTPLVSAFRVSTFQSMARRFSLTSTAPVAIARYAAHIFCWRWDGAQIRTTWGSPTQALPSTNADSLLSTISCAPVHPESGR